MSAGRKWIIAVVVALVGVLVLYYGVLAGPGDDPGAEGGMLADDPTQANNTNVENEGAQPGATRLSGAQGNESGFLTDTMNKLDGSALATNREGAAPYNVIGADGTVQPITVAHDPNDSLIRDLSTSGRRPVVTPDPGKGDVVIPSGPPVDDPLTIAANEEEKSATATPAVAPTTLPPKYETYVIKDGDTMSSIAAAWFGDGRKWDLIAKANPLVDPKKMQVGQKLNLPAKDARREQPTPGAREYTVRPGDTLVSIARAIYGDGSRWRTIYEANKSAIGSDPDHVTVGMKLRIPASSRS